MRHTRYNGGIIRPRGIKWLAELNSNYHAKRKVFATQDQCRTWIDQEQLIAQRVIPKPSQRELIDADDARKLLPKCTTLTDSAKFWIDHHKQNPLANCRVSELYDRYLKEKAAAGLRPRSIADLRANLGRLARDRGKLSIADVSPITLHDYLNAGNYSPVTRNNLRRYWLGFFEYCRKLGAISNNPAESISISRVDESMPLIFTPNQAQSILTAAKKKRPALIPAIAIGMLAGVRSSELLALKWEDISETHIRVIPEVAKKRRQRLIPINDTLQRLIAKRRAKTGRVCPLHHRRFYVALKEVAVEAGMPAWPKNAMRHSFASYHLALYQDAGKTAMLLGHTQNAAVLWDHYRELCSESDARKYFAIKIRGGIRAE